MGISRQVFDSRITELDTQGIIGFTQSFVRDLSRGMSAVNFELFPWMEELSSRKFRGVLCLGMGGSAAGGDFLSTLADHEGSIPVIVHREYNIPSWLNDSWLVLATSHSGNTEETISAAEEAAKIGCEVIAISTGGILAGLCEHYPNMNLVTSIGGQPPRTAFGHIFSRQLEILRALEILPRMSTEQAQAMFNRLQHINEKFDFTNGDEFDLLSISNDLVDRNIAVWGPTELSCCVNRFKNQLNENSARFVRAGIIPEMNHNESVAWGGVGSDQDSMVEHQGLFLLTHDSLNPRVLKRFDWMVGHLGTEAAWKLNAEGDTLLEKQLYLCILMDWISIALAIVLGKDPGAIGPINSLKEYLND